MQSKTPIEKEGKGKGRTIKIVLFLVIIFISIYFAFNSSLFNIQKVRVSNTKYLLKEDILESAKIEKGINIFKIKSRPIEKKLLENPIIKAVSIKKELPNSINIDIVERKRLFLLEYISEYLVVDEEGIIIENLDVKEKDMTLLKGFNTDSTDLGKSVFGKEENKNFEVLINEAKELKILSKMQEIEKDFANDIKIVLKSGISVAFGTLDNVKYKMSILKQIMEDIDKREIKSGRIIMNDGNYPRLIIDD